MKHALALFIALITIANHLYAQQIVDGPEGKKILLNEDGSWEAIDEANLINTADGRKALIKPDNTWEYVDATESVPQSNPVAPRVDENGVVVISMNRPQPTVVNQPQKFSYLIDEVYISEKETRAGASKGTRRASSVHFKLQISSAQENTLPPLDKSALSVTDSRGNNYEITDATLSTRNISPENTAFLTVVTHDSPMRYLSAKEIYLEVDRDALGNNEPLKIAQAMNMVERIEE